MSKNTVIVEREFNVAPSLVWKALTEKDLMKQWYIEVEDFKPKVGFKFIFWGGEEGDKKWKHLCEITEVILEKKLCHSWKYEGYTGMSHVCFELFETENGTLLRLTHTGLDSFPAIPELAIGNFENGWTQLINASLKEFLES